MVKKKTKLGMLQSCYSWGLNSNSVFSFFLSNSCFVSDLGCACIGGEVCVKCELGFLFFVFLRWWKDAQDSRPETELESESELKRGVVFSASPASSYAGPMKLINNIFSLDLVFNLRREEDSVQRQNGEVGVSGRDYALVSGQMWVQALRWSVLYIASSYIMLTDQLHALINSSFFQFQQNLYVFI